MRRKEIRTAAKRRRKERNNQPTPKAKKWRKRHGIK